MLVCTSNPTATTLTPQIHTMHTRNIYKWRNKKIKKRTPARERKNTHIHAYRVSHFFLYALYVLPKN